jgi:hypothetical protein
MEGMPFFGAQFFVDRNRHSGKIVFNFSGRKIGSDDRSPAGRKKKVGQEA